MVTDVRRSEDKLCKALEIVIPCLVYRILLDIFLEKSLTEIGQFSRIRVDRTHL